MPLLHRKLFIPDLPPEDLDPEEEVFHCTLTNEIFRDYEEFYERTILCNSLVWSCSITDKPNLTYQEALDCEKSARKRLSNFPLSIQKPVLFLVGLSNRSRIDDLNEDVYSFVKERYFVGEEVDAVIGNKGRRATCRITKILPCAKAAVNGHLNGKHLKDQRDSNDDDEDDDDDDVPLSSYTKVKPLDPADIDYQVKRLKGNDGDVEHIVSAVNIRRKQGVYTRQGSKLFIKANCRKPGGIVYAVKHKTKLQLNLDSLTWDDIFVGPKPSFANSPPRKIIGNGPKAKQVLKQNAGKDQLGKEKNDLKQVREQEKEERRRQREENRKLKAEELEKLREAARIDRERRRKEKEEELLKTKLERETIRHQRQEEKKRLAEYLKEWSRPRDDLECDDLKDLPIPREIRTEVPASLFGDILSLLEFFHVFSGLFETADEFPKGVTFELLTRAIMDHDHDGPLCDLFFFFLSNLFRSHAEEEESFEKILVEPGDKELASQINEVMNEETVQAAVTLTATWPLAYQGFALNKLELDSFTVSEVLRIYLLSTATRPRSEDRLWRYQHRGGYSCFDDTPLRLCIDRPDLIRKLSTTAVFDLEPDEKLALLLCLSHHLLSFVTPRDYLDETYEKLQQARLAYRDDKTAEKKREKESAAEKWKWRCDQYSLEKQAREKEITERLKRIQQGLPMELNEAERTLRKRKPEDEENRIYSPEEKEKRLRLFDEEEAQAKDAWKFRLHKHQQSVAKLSAAFRTSNLGLDRYFRRYWLIPDLPGLFVEEYKDESLTDEVLSIRAPQKLAPTLHPYPASGCSTPGGRSDGSAVGTPIGLTATKPIISLAQLQCVNGSSYDVKSGVSGLGLQLGAQQKTSAPASPMPVAQVADSSAVPVNGEAEPIKLCTASSFNKPQTQGKEHRWFVFCATESIEQLISSLNTRGHRESKLLEKLTIQKDLILESMSSNSDALLNLQELLADSEKIQRVRINEKSGTVLEKLLRDQILDLETRVWAGTLGFIQVEDRAVWREAISSGTKFEGDIDTTVPEQPVEDEDKKEEEIICEPSIGLPLPASKLNCRDETSDAEEMETDECSAVHELAVALLVIERGVDRKYLKPPLGAAEDVSRSTRSRAANEENIEEKKMKADILLNRWERSLLQTTSLSQIFLHLSTLERCIMWSRSVLNAKCRICRRKGDAEKMLLCDVCDRGHHMYCLRPALKTVPPGDWFCPDCQPQSPRISPRKVVRTKSFSQDESSEEDDEEEDEEAVDSDDEDTVEEGSASSADDVPTKGNLTYKIPGKPQRRGQKCSTQPKSRPSDPKRSSRRSDAKDEADKSNSRRRSAGVWKDLSTCEEILCDLVKHKDSWPFLEPVSKKMVPDYYDIIKKPMDLGTVQKKFKEVKYQTPATFIADIDQIFLNCHEYNESRSVVARAASHLQTYFDSKLNKACIAHYRPPFNAAKKRRTT